MIILTKKQFENVNSNITLAFEYNLNLILFWRAERARKIFGVWHLKYADKWVLGNYWRQIIFFTVPLSKIIFLAKIRARKFFSKKTQAPPPPEYQMDRA